ncbi:Imm26 family immunity protein [Chitinilyticum piscinae]|uniref:Phosphotriesterase n=1 Tax=Chitinilyticum piscinae TaxID=2866724 RepID=A0A8J7FHW5_9NEIS|nr:Imm26 family immunity protein [Chitinilyticum piscinae]MBE9609753.1 phosphotriesterase [Chitinilyticum piscinae]
MKLKFIPWNSKPRTMLRYLKPGHIFALQLDATRFAFGRIIATPTAGTPAEFFDIIKDSPVLGEDEISAAQRLIHPLIIDAYSLFDRRILGNWQMIALQEDFIAHDAAQIFFWYGDPIGGYKKTNALGETIGLIPESEAKTMQDAGLSGDRYVRFHILKVLNEISTMPEVPLLHPA